MYQLNYIHIKTKEISSITGNSETHVIEKYNREVAMFPTSYKIIEILDLESIQAEKIINDRKEKVKKDTIKKINRVINSLVKKPYNSKNRPIVKNIEYDRYCFDNIKEHFKEFKVENDFYLYNGCIELYIYKNNVQISPTQEYFESAD